jgi:hypothetical protein
MIHSNQSFIIEEIIGPQIGHGSYREHWDVDDRGTITTKKEHNKQWPPPPTHHQFHSFCYSRQWIYPQTDPISIPFIMSTSTSSATQASNTSTSAASTTDAVSSVYQDLIQFLQSPRPDLRLEATKAVLQTVHDR